MDEKMTEKLSSLEARMEHIAAQVEALSRKVDRLTAKADVEQAGTVPNGAAAQDNGFPDASEALLSWVGRSSFLQRLSTICFLLVVALILRTITDNGIINRQLGSAIGMSYAAALMAVGWFRYGRANPLAPVFAVCGTVLMFTVIGESHARFSALSSVPAYLFLMLTGLGTAVISYIHRAPVPVAVGSLGMYRGGTGNPGALAASVAAGAGKWPVRGKNHIQPVAAGDRCI